MKKILATILLLGSTIAFAHAEGKQYVGVQLGFTQPITRLNMPVSGKEKELTPTTFNGFKVGVIYDATLIKGFGYTIGLNYTFGANQTKWEKDKTTQPGEFPKKKVANICHLLEIPVDWQYKFEIAQNTWFTLYTGPTLQCGLSFKQDTYMQSKPNGEINIQSQDRYKMSGDIALNRLNVTWGVGAGLQYQRYFVRGGYDFGLINPYKALVFEVNDDYRPYTRGRFDQWQVKVGMYLFSK
jgi:hypothetical protein